MHVQTATVNSPLLSCSPMPIVMLNSHLCSWLQFCSSVPSFTSFRPWQLVGSYQFPTHADWPISGAAPEKISTFFSVFLALIFSCLLFTSPSALHLPSSPLLIWLILGLLFFLLYLTGSNPHQPSCSLRFAGMGSSRPCGLLCLVRSLPDRPFSSR